MKKHLAAISLSLFTTLACAHTTNLWQVYNQAKKSDPTFQNARATWLAAKQMLPMSVAAVLPTVSAKGDFVSTVNRVKANAGGISAITGEFNAISRTLAFTATQPIINFQAFAGVKVARSQVKQAAAVYAAAKQTLITSVAKDYFNVLLAKDTLRFTRAELRATERQLDQAKQRYKVGLVAITNVYQTQAQYDTIVAELISAKNALNNSRETLRQLTGTYYTNLAPLKTRIPLVKPDPSNINAWVEHAIHQNMLLMAAHFAMQAARANVAVQFAGHLPTLSAIGTISHSLSDPTPVAPFPADTVAKSLDLQVAVPLFSGGMVHAQTKQAHYLYRAAVDTFEQQYRATVASTRQNYNNIVAGLSKIRADKQSIISHRASLKSTEAAYRVGTNTIIDVLETQKDLYQAQQLFASDQYTYINDTLALKQDAGTLCESDLFTINSWLRHSTKAHGPLKRKPKHQTHRKPRSHPHPHKQAKRVAKASHHKTVAKTTKHHVKHSALHTKVTKRHVAHSRAHTKVNRHHTASNKAPLLAHK